MIARAAAVPALEREHQRRTKPSRQVGELAAATMSPIDSQAWKMPVVNVCTAKYDTAPKSASVSISASAVPAAIAGRASGSATRKKLPHAP